MQFNQLPWQAELLVDSANIHITGYSNGGTLVYRMYSESRARLAGLGAVSGAPFIGGGQPNPDRSLIDFHGRLDSTVPHDYENSAGEVCNACYCRDQGFTTVCRARPAWCGLSSLGTVCCVLCTVQYCCCRSVLLLQA